MSDLGLFDVAGSALSAQSVRLNTVASNLANVNDVSGDPNTVYKPRDVVFSTLASGKAGLAGVRTDGVIEQNTAPLKRYEPGNPLADGQGYVYAPDIDPVAQMVNMISSARAYQDNVEVMNTAKELALSTLSLGS